MYHVHNLYIWTLLYVSQDFCLDLFEPSGHGKRKRSVVDLTSRDYVPKVDRFIKRYNDSTPFTKFKENIEYTVMMPEGKLFPLQIEIQYAIINNLIIMI